MRGIALIVPAGAVVCASAFVFSLLVHGTPRGAVASTEAATAPSRTATAATKPSARAKVKKQRATSRVPPGVVAIVATGDIVMGSSPNLPPDGGRTFFSDVQTLQATS